MNTILNWFFASGDAEFFYREELQSLTFFPDVWKGQAGLGVSTLQYLWIDYPFRLITFLLSRLGMSWFIIDKLWWGLVFFLCIFSAYKFISLINIHNKYKWIASLIYATNTYILMVFDGGQLGVGLCYSLVPLVFYYLYNYFKSTDNKFKQSIKAGLLVSILLFLDLRIGYIFSSIFVLFIIVLALKKQLIISKEVILIPLIILCINCFWLLPTILYKNSLATFVLQTNSTNSDLSFFSVASFTDSLSLLHPNYPDNIFGYIYFFKSEFLVIPLLGFIFLLSGRVSLFTSIIVFVGLIGTFLAKGVNEPFGGVYTALYTYIPGFFLFRDPTKWYLLVALSYTILIPQSIAWIVGRLRNKSLIIILIFLVFWMFTLRFIFTGRVSGNVTPLSMKEDYQNLKDILVQDTGVGRTVWLPNLERFEFSTEEHPAIPAIALFSESSASGITSLFNYHSTLEKISSIGGSYIIVPHDVEKRIFLEDYAYSENLRTKLIDTLDNEPRLSKVQGFKVLTVYKNDNAKSFFTYKDRSLNAKSEIYDTWKINLPRRDSEDILSTLIAYDPNWMLTVNDMDIKPTAQNEFMFFSLPPGDEAVALLEYLPTKIARKGAFVSIVTFITCLLILLL